MPKNKAPRKKYRPKYCLSHSKITQEQIDHMHSIFTRFEFAVESKLPRGVCTTDDMWCIRDCFNMACIAWATRDYLDKDAISEIKEEFSRAQQAVADVTARGLECEHYVCTAEELNLIRTQMNIVGDFIHYTIDKQPRRFITEWKAMKSLLRDKEGKFSFNIDTLESEIERQISKTSVAG